MLIHAVPAAQSVQDACQLPLAGLPRRLCALFYDLLLCSGVLFMLFFLPHTLLGLFWQQSMHGGWLLLHIFFVSMLYFCFFWTRSGQTLAMRSWRIRLVDASGVAVTPQQALVRYLSAWPLYLLAGVTLWWAIIDRDGQFLHDRLAGTRLVMQPDVLIGKC